MPANQVFLALEGAISDQYVWNEMRKEGGKKEEEEQI